MSFSFVLSRDIECRILHFILIHKHKIELVDPFEHGLMEAFEHHFTHRAAEDYDSPEASVYILNLLQLIVQMQFTQNNFFTEKNYHRLSQTTYKYLHGKKLFTAFTNLIFVLTRVRIRIRYVQKK